MCKNKRFSALLSLREVCGTEKQNSSAIFSTVIWSKSLRYNIARSSSLRIHSSIRFFHSEYERSKSLCFIITPKPKLPFYSIVSLGLFAVQVKNGTFNKIFNGIHINSKAFVIKKLKDIGFLLLTHTAFGVNHFCCIYCNLNPFCNVVKLCFSVFLFEKRDSISRRNSNDNSDDSNYNFSKVNIIFPCYSSLKCSPVISTLFSFISLILFSAFALL